LVTDVARQSRRSDGALQRRREQLPWPAGKRFRILSIDGGGIRGILPASILAKFEQRHLGGRCVGDYFDLITGTSTGGIIALGLAKGIPASEILQLYVHHGAEIFPARDGFRRVRAAWDAVRSLHLYKYDRAPLERELQRIFGDSLFGDTSRRLCIPSFDGFTEVNVFKTPHHPDFRLDWREQITTVALATSAAPTFFSVYRNGDRRFADGGVWANNPIMVGLVDALSCNAIDRDAIDILSIGCGEQEMLMTDRQVRFGGLFHWRQIISSAMSLAGQNALGQAGLLIGRDNVVRLDAPLLGVPIRLDDVQRSITELPNIASELVERHHGLVLNRFFSTSAEPYLPFHGPRVN
jgi:patatin-like phospholipase/acyl hydrolase